jgi:hypothetical protein
VEVRRWRASGPPGLLPRPLLLRAWRVRTSPPIQENHHEAVEQVASAELVLPLGVQEALGELVGAAKDGPLALSVGVGLGGWPR